MVLDPPHDLLTAHRQDWQSLLAPHAIYRILKTCNMTPYPSRVGLFRLFASLCAHLHTSMTATSAAGPTVSPIASTSSYSSNSLGLMGLPQITGAWALLKTRCALQFPGHRSVTHGSACNPNATGVEHDLMSLDWDKGYRNLPKCHEGNYLAVARWIMVGISKGYS